MPEVLLATTRRAVEHTRLLRENGRLREAVVRLEGSSETSREQRGESRRCARRSRASRRPMPRS